MKVDHLLYAGNSLEKARQLFDEALAADQLTSGQRTRVLRQWPA